MRMHLLAAIPPWEWPSDASDQIQAVLADQTELGSERLLAAELAGDLVVMNDELAQELLRIIGSQGEPSNLRAQAALSLGAALEEADMFDSGDPDFPTLGEAMLARSKKALQACYQDPGVPKEVRRRALEASVRSEDSWHPGAVRAAYHDGDREWKLTAVFCMRFVEGFEEEIVETLSSDDADILYEAILAARDSQVSEAWPTVRDLTLSAAAGVPLVPDDPDAERAIVLAAISAVAAIRPLEAAEVLEGLVDSEDEEYAEAALEALEVMDDLWGLEEDEEDGPTWH